MMNDPKERVLVSLQRDQIDGLDRLREQTLGRPARSALIREAVRRMLEAERATSDAA